MKLTGLALPVLFAFCLPTLLLAEDGPEDHLGGFFLRLSGGGGYASTSIGNGTTLKLSGGAADLNIAIGGIISPNLALHGTLLGWAISDPKVSISGLSGSANADLTLSGFGGGLTYYFMPANFYISGTVGIGKLKIDGSGISGETDFGLIFDGTAGKEWWVGESWALGVAVGLGFHSIPEKNISENWSGTSVVVRFTATMN